MRTSTEPRTRFPGYVYRAGADPDPRFSLANERTFLAWLRTALALAAVAVAVDFGAAAADLAAPTPVVVALAGTSATVAVLAWGRWAQVERALRHGDPLPGPALTGALTAAAVAAVAALVAVTALR